MVENLQNPLTIGDWLFLPLCPPPLCSAGPIILRTVVDGSAEFDATARSK